MNSAGILRLQHNPRWLTSFGNAAVLMRAGYGKVGGHLNICSLHERHIQMSTPVQGNATPYLIPATRTETLDVLGPTIEFLMPPAETGDSYCILRGTIGPGVFVPLHSHEDLETFFMLSGELEGVAQSAEGFSWIAMAPGDVFHVPAGAKHAFRNRSAAPAVAFIVSTARIGRFFREIGRPVPRNRPPSPPTPDLIQHFLKTGEAYGYWMANAEENAELGLHLPGLPTG